MVEFVGAGFTIGLIGRIGRIGVEGRDGSDGSDKSDISDGVRQVRRVPWPVNYCTLSYPSSLLSLTQPH